MNGTKRSAWLALVLTLVLSVLAFETSSASAAQSSCQAGASTSFTVATEAQLNAAIACYNSGGSGPGDYTITLAADVVSLVDGTGNGFTTIAQQRAGFTLTLEGAGYALEVTRVPVLLQLQNNRGPVTINNLDIPTQFRSTLAIETTGSGPLTVTNSRIAGHPGIFAQDSGLLTVENSIIEGGRGGLEVEDGDLTVRRSALLWDATTPHERDSRPFGGGGQDIVHRGNGNLLVENSTMYSVTREGDANVTGTAIVRNSTTMWANANHFRAPAIAPITISSSVVFFGDCDQLIDGGANTGCFGTRTNQPGDTLRWYLDNGCQTPTPAGCVVTSSLPPGSPAIGTGNCASVTTDARGQARTPAGFGCDAGAYEIDSGPQIEICAGKAVTINLNHNGGNGTGTLGDDVIWGTEGPDVIQSGAGNDIICARAGDDLVKADAGEDVVFGDDGNDRLFGGQGVDLIFGDDGNDTIHGNRGADFLIGGEGNDRIFGYSQNDRITGGPGDDRLHGNFGDDFLIGSEGNDRLFGYADDDVLWGNDGNDMMVGNFGDDRLVGDIGNDTLIGADGNDELIGGSGEDTLTGNSGNDMLEGDSGFDTLDGGVGSDSCDGGPEIDTATRCESVVGIP